MIASGTSKGLTHDKRLDVISRAWGRNRGHVFLAWIDRHEQAQSGTRRAGFYEHSFNWPADRDKMVACMDEHWVHDMYWCPSVFEFDERKTEYAMEEQALWADLDEANPHTIEDYPPTIAWETSPGRYQAVWIVRQGDMLGASWPGGENQRLTYHLGADKGGWDTTQLLRIPEWPNHKLHYVKEHGEPPMGELLWKGGQWYSPGDFDELPEISTAANVAEDILEDQIDTADRDAILGRIKLKLPKHIREFVYARSTDGQDRSSVLWQIERSLADVGCNVVEIVAVVRELVWNKYSGRHDEIRRLILEATKAVDQRPDEVVEQQSLEEQAAEKPKLQNIFLLTANIKRPAWLVQGIWAEGSCGFIAGQPKSWKSWIGMDLALSVASGRPFLDTFTVVRPRPVIYIQEEDSAPLIKDRIDKIWPAKNQARYELVHTTDAPIGADGVEVWSEPAPDRIDPEAMRLDAIIRQGFVISDEGWLHWLASALEDARNAEDPYGLLVIDPLMMSAGDVEENRAQEMTTKVFRPLKQLAEEYKVSVCLVHHMRKGDPKSPTRGGQLMLGSMANHAWAEDSLYVTHKAGRLHLEHESKHAEGGNYSLSGIKGKGWQPAIGRPEPEQGGKSVIDGRHAVGKTSGSHTNLARASARTLRSPALVALQELGAGSHSTRTIAETIGGSCTNSRALQQLRRALERGYVEKASGGRWVLATPRQV